MNKPITCCYGCKERDAMCHSTCEAYLAEKKVHDAERERIHGIKKQHSEYVTATVAGIKRMKTKRKRK